MFTYVIILAYLNAMLYEYGNQRERGKKHIFWDFRSVWHLIMKPFELVVFIWGLKSFDISVRWFSLPHPQIVSYGTLRTLNQDTNELLSGLSLSLFLPFLFSPCIPPLSSSSLYPLLHLLLTIYNTQSPLFILSVFVSHFHLCTYKCICFVYLFRSSVW